jgi:hypothetical protein
MLGSMNDACEHPFSPCGQSLDSGRRLFVLVVVTLGATAHYLIQAQDTSNAEPSAPITLSPVMVTGKKPSLHDVALESDRVGPVNQPEWTTRRAFAETDIYVIPSGEIEFNQFYISSHPRQGKPENLVESEFEFGLPWRTQFDVELNYSLDQGRAQYDATRVEVPHALADWGKILLNPALDAGWRFRNGESDSYQFRLLLAQELGKRWHFGANLGFEQQVGGERETDYELNTAVSYVAIDRRLTLGAELLVEYETDNADPSLTQVMLGPTLLFKPSRNTHLGLVSLFGLNSDAPVADIYLIFGIDLEPFAGKGAIDGESGKDERGIQPVRRPR